MERGGRGIGEGRKHTKGGGGGGEAEVAALTRCAACDGRITQLGLQHAASSASDSHLVAMPPPLVHCSPQAQRLRASMKKNGLPLLYRFMCMACACVAFSLIASTGTRSGTVNGIEMKGRKFRHYRTLNFALSSNVILFFYSFWMVLANILVLAGRFKPTVVSRRVMSFTTLLLDFTIVFLQFGAATALAGLRGGFSDLQLGNYCSISRIFCRKLVASTVLSYVAWLFLVPSLYINVVENEEGPW